MALETGQAVPFEHWYERIPLAVSVRELADGIGQIRTRHLPVQRDFQVPTRRLLVVPPRGQPAPLRLPIVADSNRQPRSV